MPANSSESCSHCISLSHTFNYSVVNLPAPLIRSHIKTRTLLQPFVRLYPTVAVGVGTQVTVTAHTGDAEILLQAADEGTHREFLLLCAGIRRMSVLIQATLVGDADALAVEPQGVGTYLLQRTSAPNVAILADVEVIADALHPPCPVAAEQILLREVHIHPRSGAMHHNQRHHTLHATQAVTPSAPAIPVATAMTIFKMSFHTFSFLSLFISLFIMVCVFGANTPVRPQG